MVPVDDTILELLADLGEPLGQRVGLSPAIIYHYLHEELAVTDKSRSTIQRRLRRLHDAGLVGRVEDPVHYRITEFGLRYLDEELDQSDRQDLSDA